VRYGLGLGNRAGHRVMSLETPERLRQLACLAPSLLFRALELLSAVTQLPIMGERDSLMLPQKILHRVETMFERYVLAASRAEGQADARGDEAEEIRRR